MRTFLLTLPFLTLAACGFGDDGRLQQATIDAATIDAPMEIPIDAAPMAQTFEARPSQAIPDNNTTGISIPFNVTNVTFITGVEVEVDVTHPYRGDLKIELLRGTTVLKLLKARTPGDGIDDVKAVYQVTPAELGTPLNAIYSVKFSDEAVTDTGVVNYVRLTFKVT